MKTSELTSTLVVKQPVIDMIKNGFDEGFPTEHWDPSVLNFRKVDILQIYEEEKEKLRIFFSQLSGRVSLIIESVGSWSVLTAYYIDENWAQKCKFISFVNCERGGGRSFIASLKEICSDLKIDGKICSVVDDYEGYGGNGTDDVIGENNSLFTKKGSLPFGGVLDLMNKTLCQDIFDSTNKVLRDQCLGILECVAYVNEPSNQDKFRSAVNEVKSMGKKVTSERLPPLVFWEGMKIPLGYKEAFCKLEQIDPHFKTKNLTKENWDEATAAWELGNSIKNVWTLFERKPTPNMYFSKFCDVYVKFLVAGENTSFEMKRIASGIRVFIDKCWKKYSLILVITVILDPRFKKEIVQLWYKKIYGCDADRHFKEIINDFNDVYNEYAKGMETSSISYLDAMGMPCGSSHNLNSPKSELDRYLEEPKFPSVENFDILAWRRLYSPIFPILARMARDFLAVPIAFHIPFYRAAAADCIMSHKKLDADL